MKNRNQGFTNFSIIFCLVIVLAGIVLKPFIDAALWKNLIAIICVSSAIFALSDLFKKSADDQRNLAALSASIIKPIYERFAELGLLVDSEGKDLTKARYQDEIELNRELRNIADGDERAVRELIWEHRSLSRRLRHSRGDSVFRVIFLILSVVVLVGSLVVLFFFPQYYPRISEEYLDGAMCCAFAIALASAFAAGGSLRILQKVETLLGLKERCILILRRMEHPAPPPFQPESAESSAPAEASVPAPSAGLVSASDPAPAFPPVEAPRPAYSFHEEIEPVSPSVGSVSSPEKPDEFSPASAVEEKAETGGTDAE